MFLQARDPVERQAVGHQKIGEAAAGTTGNGEVVGSQGESYWKCNFLMTPPICLLVIWLVRKSVIKGQEVTLPCSYWSTWP